MENLRRETLRSILSTGHLVWLELRAQGEMERVEAGEDETAKSQLSKGCGCHAAEHRPPPEGAGKPWENF